MNARFGYGSPAELDEVSDVLRLAEQADRDGLDHFSTSDHPYLAGRLDGYAMLGFLLGRTERIAGLVNVTNLPLRPAPMLARTAATLTAMSADRFILGLGAGGAWDRITTMGVPSLTPAQAVEAFEEAMVLIRQLSGGGPAVSSGAHYPVRGLAASPVRAAEIWTGSVGPKSLAATGRQADGWIPGHAADWLSEPYRRSRAIVDEAAAAVGREPAEIATIYNLPGAITARPLPRTRDDDGRWIGGSADQWTEELTGAVLDHGAAGFTLFPTGPDPFEVSLKRWAEEVAPAVREATAQLTPAPAATV
ncbi:LLM class flavin-dependent oxidoreductase [Kribbella qitaiheensis]|uniref:LLM class flavin-dependent oxidoreductase n=1 Tax=Kribbella qitaiheensis TaxID=1544730 RepID=A0A7G6WYN4_9ACTN|nr:LLM class flavin-dependent oxidoreductase [Kribbella qitaiheensis]QNE19099.1 LLM class flavin-dependent oxidoreductase [Kribbella qitaiheensis]